MRLNKNIRLALAIVPLFAVSIMGNSVANAAVAPDGKSATTAANLTLLEKSGPVDPLDPSKPVQPLNPGTPTTGDLRMDYISDLHFGSHEISGTSETYFAAFDKVADLSGHRDPVTGGWVTTGLGSYRDVPNYAQITNNTTGNWQLNVRNTPFTGANGGVLKGASLLLDNIEGHNTIVGSTISPNRTKLLGNNRDFSVVVTDGVSDKPAGTWTLAMGNMSPLSPDSKGNQSVKLTVPGYSEKVVGETYTSTLTWTLIAAP
ncbi:WxL domain-containing protein [Dellaglioa carnosa]|uniref:WxL domain-containing protein n=1 Tax=Dellaglioa carnosa TaxID=2995136 RepID=A0ABT4JJR2_9LACO|nr:WxL domain-containing protein [Dellaglioa carnosa]MCZ2490592.1 WxL domain-containing protein [Dellaglioa carnosa]MCZ2493670.1 WxL domain-containing protein [Dellaglioa carnosa]MDK1730534.1 WxL domain-containing protein [Dellaglioa carnosa]